MKAILIKLALLFVVSAGVTGCASNCPRGHFSCGFN